MNDDGCWCQNCHEPITYWSEFVAHAEAGHAVMQGEPEATS
jgi:hypothetical protein